VTVTASSSFSPAAILVAPSAVVTWTWASGNIDHNVTFANGAITSSGTQNSGTFQSTMPAAVGTYSYQCSIHGSAMSGTVQVQ
jgi:plastocyanin